MRWFRTQRSVDVMSQNLANTFSRVKHDMDHLHAWINYLHKKNLEIESKHENNKVNISVEVENLKKWVSYLNNSLDDLYKYFEKNNEMLCRLEEQNKEISERITKIENKGQVRTSHGTSQGQVRDMKNEEIIVEKTTHYDRSILTQSELEVMNILYNSDRPLGYADISKMLGKEEKSIRNLIYELRKKGVKVSDKPIGQREKGFFLTKEERIKVSGR